MCFDTASWKNLIETFFRTMEAAAGIATTRLSADKWTLAEMTGHLIDSASNNHQRFVRLQLAPALSFPAYDAEEWRKASNVSAYDYAELVRFWKQYNLFLLHIIEQIDETSLSNCWQKGTEQISLRFLVEDYYRHLAWHLDLFEERIGELRDATGTISHP